MIYQNTFVIFIRSIHSEAARLSLLYSNRITKYEIIFYKIYFSKFLKYMCVFENSCSRTIIYLNFVFKEYHCIKSTYVHKSPEGYSIIKILCNEWVGYGDGVLIVHIFRIFKKILQ